ncbi:MAG: aminotransferase class I/II-fold pyridoxal phosphate-dependent enzyme [Planctomycetes bacterium]|nr:aminotransferase class I/II-fold pyridoxal phosphate-dependent enzyme [Planctomycetota bacterium]
MSCRRSRSRSSRLAIEHGVVNLSQGFLDFEGPREIVEAAVSALRSGENQYVRSPGRLDLVQAIAWAWKRHHGLEYDPLTEVVVFSGATEGIASSLLGLLNARDEVILFEPFYATSRQDLRTARRSEAALMRAPSAAWDAARTAAGDSPLLTPDFRLLRTSNSRRRRPDVARLSGSRRRRDYRG